MVRIGLSICLLLLLLSRNVAAEERDPFAPYMEPQLDVIETGEVEEKVNEYDTHSTVRPLNKHPLKSYRLIGVIISPEQGVAVIRDPDYIDHFVSVGDALGSEGGMVESMTGEGLAVDLGTEIVHMQVMNKMDIQNN